MDLFGLWFTTFNQTGFQSHGYLKRMPMSRIKMKFQTLSLSPFNYIILAFEFLTVLSIFLPRKSKWSNGFFRGDYLEFNWLKAYQKSCFKHCCSKLFWTSLAISSTLKPPIAIRNEFHHASLGMSLHTPKIIDFFFFMNI